MSGKKNKILILGCSGRLGGYLKKKLDSRKHKFIYHEGKTDYDLSDESTVFKYLKKKNPDTIINAVAISDVEYCENNPIESFKINTILPKNLSNWVNYNNRFLIHISTDHIYDGKFLKDENNSLKLKNIYALTKYYGEWYASKCKSTILRTNFFGKTIDHSTASFSDWLCSNLDSKKKLLLYDNIFFNPVHISTLGFIIEMIINNPKYGIFNVGSKNGISKYNFGRILNELKGCKNKKIIAIKYKVSENLINRPYDMRTNVSRFEKAYNLNLPQIKAEIKKVINDD